MGVLLLGNACRFALSLIGGDGIVANERLDVESGHKAVLGYSEPKADLTPPLCVIRVQVFRRPKIIFSGPFPVYTAAFQPMPVTLVISMPAMNTLVIAVKHPETIFLVPYPIDVQVANKIRVLCVELISSPIRNLDQPVPISCADSCGKLTRRTYGRALFVDLLGRTNTHRR